MEIYYDKVRKEIDTSQIIIHPPKYLQTSCILKLNGKFVLL
jgi:hypothetical protein